MKMKELISPEYSKLTEDCNIDLALIRWGLNTLIEIVDILNVEDELMQKWREVLDKLVDYQIDETGFMIGRNVPLEESHRHFSHLLPIFPLYLVNWEQKQNRELIEKSVDRWVNLAGKLEGYTYTAAASMCTTMGRADKAVEYINEMIDEYIEPNTMYLEAGPCIETPLSGAKSIQDMVLQSWGGYINIFPSIPDSWSDVTIHDMRTEGAFLVSAARKDGKLAFVRIKSLAGEICRFKADFVNPVVIAKDVKLEYIGDKVYEALLLKGEELIVCEKGFEDNLAIEPVEEETQRCNFFGGVSGLGRKDL